VQDEVLLDPPGLDLAQHVERRGPASQLVLAGLELARGAAHDGQEHEAHATPDHPRRVQAAGDIQDPVVGWNLDENDPESSLAAGVRTSCATPTTAPMLSSTTRPMTRRNCMISQCKH